MKFLWTRSTYLGKGTGDLITWGLEEPVSHFAIEFSDGDVFHSSIFGVDIISSKEFYKHRELVFDHKFNIISRTEENIRYYLIQFLHLDYDFKFFFWLIWVSLKLKLFNKPIPDKIEDQQNGGILCTEALNLLPKQHRMGIDVSRVTTPYKLYKIIKGLSNEVS